MIRPKLTKLILILSSVSLLTMVASLIPQPSTELDAATPANFSTITYELDWHWGDALLTSEGWFVTNDQGYQIHVRRGYVVNRSLELIECAASDAVSESMTNLLRNALTAQPAYAGHGTDARDASRITKPFVESLTEPVAQTVETVLVTSPNYCQLHYLVAPGIDTARHLPREVEMKGVTLWLEGNYIAPDTTTPMPFTISTDLAWGDAVDMITPSAEPLADLQSDSVALQIVVHRDLEALFNGIDFEAMSATEQAKAVLRSLTQNIEVVIQAESL